MAYEGYAPYAADGGYAEEPGGYGAPDAQSELSGPNSSAYERTYSPGGGTETSYAAEDAGGTVYYRDTGFVGGTYDSAYGSFASRGGYFGSAYYGDRYSSFSDVNGIGGDAPEPLYAEGQLAGPDSSAYDRASSPSFGTETDYAIEGADGAQYQRQALYYGSAGNTNYLTDTSYTSASGTYGYDIKTYAHTGLAYHYYGHSSTIATYSSIDVSGGTISEYSYALYENGSHETSVFETGSPSYSYSVYTNSAGVSYADGSYGMR